MIKYTIIAEEDGKRETGYVMSRRGLTGDEAELRKVLAAMLQGLEPDEDTRRSEEFINTMKTAILAGK